MMSEEKLKSLEEYKETLQRIIPVQEHSGVACPQCGTEMHWGEQSMFPTNPPMKRLNCVECEYSEVVPI